MQRASWKGCARARAARMGPRLGAEMTPVSFPPALPDRLKDAPRPVVLTAEETPTPIRDAVLRSAKAIPASKHNRLTFALENTRGFDLAFVHKRTTTDGDIWEFGSYVGKHAGSWQGGVFLTGIF